MDGIMSALALGLLLVLAPTAVVAVLIYVCSSGTVSYTHLTLPTKA